MRLPSTQTPMHRLTLSWLLDNESSLVPLNIIKLPPDSVIPSSITTTTFGRDSILSISRTKEELSIVGAVTIDELDSQTSRGWVAFKVVGSLDFSLIGILASITSRLADVGISVFAISTYLTDYVLIQAKDAKLTELALDGYCGRNVEFSFENCMFTHTTRSRVLTLISTLERLTSLQSSAMPSPTAATALQNPEGRSFVLHLVGADEMECPSFDDASLNITYHRLFRYLLVKKGISSLELVFIGPNLPAALHRQSIDFYTYDSKEGDVKPTWPPAILSKIHSSLQECGLALKVTVEAWVGLYHEYLESRDEKAKAIASVRNQGPDLVALFNPGLWGYDHWLPTLEAFNSLRGRQGQGQRQRHRHLESSIIGNQQSPVFIVTSYTFEEAEDDLDVVESIFSKEKSGGGRM